MSDDTQYHVTLRHPVHVKVQDDSIRVVAFDTIEVERVVLRRSPPTWRRNRRRRTDTVSSLGDERRPDHPCRQHRGHGRATIPEGTLTLDIEIIILAQGNQARMGKDVGYKQLLPLQDCANTPILLRTIRQVRSYTGGARATIRLVAWNQMAALAARAIRNLDDWHNVTRVELDNPGNSSLKGLSRWFERRDWIGTADPQRTIVLLGDVVYSWACLDALWTLAETYGFVGTPDLSGSTGELWGVAWSNAENDAMRQQLREAMGHHPPFMTYQPGQLRRWITGGSRGELAGHVAGLKHRLHYFAIADYTMDVDLPEHIPLLIPASTLACEDDLAHGMSW